MWSGEGSRGMGEGEVTQKVDFNDRLLSIYQLLYAYL